MRKKSDRVKKIAYLIVFIAAVMLNGCNAATIDAVNPQQIPTTTGEINSQEIPNTTEHTQIELDWKNRLYTPTFVEKIGDLYFIVDCWHHRVIYNDSINTPIGDWDTLDDTLGGPHSIASDGELYVVEDTGNHAVKVYVKNNTAGFELTQHIHDIPERPHRVLYSPLTELFYILGSSGGNLYLFKNTDGVLELIETKTLDHLLDTYVRSIRIIDDCMYFVSGKNKIVVTTYLDGEFDIICEYPVTEALSSMNDIYKIGDYYYISATPQKLVRVKDLNDLQSGQYEDVFEELQYRGTPYYFSEIDGRIYLPEITEYSSVISWQIDQDGKLYDREVIFDFGLPTEDSEARKAEIVT